MPAVYQHITSVCNLRKVHGGATTVILVLMLLRAQAAPELSAPEQRTTNQLATSSGADLAEPGDQSRTNRLITAAFLRDLLTDTKYAIPTRGLYLSNAVITGELDLRNASVARDVHLMNCVFKDAVVLDGSEFEKGLSLIGCFFIGNVSAQGVVVKQSLDLSEGGATVSLDAGILKPLIEKLPPGSKTRGQIGEAKGWPSCFVGDVNFSLARVNGKFIGQGVEFCRKAEFNGMKVDGTFWFEGATFHQNANLSYVAVGDQFSMKQARFTDPNRPAEFYQLTVGGMADLDEAIFHGPVNFIQASTKGNFQANHAKFLNTNNLAEDDASRFHHNADFGSLRVDGFAFFLGTRFDGEVSFRNARFQSLYLDEVSWPTNLPRENPIRLEWMRYERIQATSGSKDAELDRSDLHWHESHVQTWENLKPVLAARSPYSADVYTSLEAFFDREGESGLARAVFIESKEQERNKVLVKQLSPDPRKWKAASLWAWNWILKITVGHGRHPEFALFYSLAFILIGCWIFRSGNMKHEKENAPHKMVPAQTRWEKFLESIKFRSHFQKYHAFWYSLDAFVPLVDLNTNEGWAPMPERRLAWNYLAVHRVAGAILIPIGFAAFSGIIK